MTTYSQRELVVQTLSGWIDNRTVTPDCALPTENELAEKIQVARGTLRSGLSELTARGVLVKRGRRLYVAAAKPPASTILGNTLVFVGTSSMKQLQELRESGYNDAIQAGAMGEAVAAGMHVLSIDQKRLDEAGIDELCERPPAGFVFFQLTLRPQPSRPDPDRVVSRLLGVKAASVCGEDRDLYRNIDRVVHDQRAGAKLLTRTLLESGRRRILSLLCPGHYGYWVAERVAGFMEAIREAGAEALPVPDFECTDTLNADVLRSLDAGLIRLPDLDVEYREALNAGCDRDAFDRHVRYTAGSLLEFFRDPEKRPDAIMARNDWDIPIVAGAVRRLGYAPGRDVEIAGYDNRYGQCFWRRYEDYPAPWTIDKQNSLIGCRMVRRLLARQAGDIAGAAEVERVPPRLVRAENERM